MSRLFYYIYLVLLYLLSLLPLRVLHAFSSMCSFLIFNVYRYRKSVIVANIARSFPEIKYDELDTIAKDFQRIFTDIFIEAIWTVSTSAKKINKRIFIEDESVERLNDILSKNRGVIITMGHRGNWEFLSSFCDIHSKSGLQFNFDYEKIVSVYQKLSNKSFDLLMRYIRTKHGINTMVESHDIVRYMLKNRDNPHVYLFIADQAPHSGEKFSTIFLNQKTYLIHGPEYVARKFDIPVVYLDMKFLEKRGTYKVDITEITSDSANTEQGYITSKYIKMLEQSLLEQKHNWLWSHKRWKREPKHDSDVTFLQ